MVHFPRFLWRSSNRLYFYKSYPTWGDALKVAKYYQKKLRSKYYILPVETFTMGRIIYGLYMSKVISLS